MNHNLKWLNKIEKEIEEQSGDDLFYLIETMYKEHKMNFLQFIYDASRGVGCIVHEGLEYVLDQDLDDSKEFDEVSFLVGDYESSTISPQKFVELMQIISNSYIEAHPNEKDSIEFYMNKLRERYSK
ncbi:hypothetical protein A9G11_09885 [Gilliamella sp. wkB108]|uniref:hypothetical protein n=1 Tax=Gilliamella sp. wkB108 TaxID=3120256 RepID=UPI00080DDAAC|nr:hypothetical protein [Gilliamella apicola]OCG19771.1 hypothetical protein A9G11_09885 [Gilliamella apicola]